MELIASYFLSFPVVSAMADATSALEPGENRSRGKIDAFSEFKPTPNEPTWFLIDLTIPLRKQDFCQPWQTDDAIGPRQTPAYAPG